MSEEEFENLNQKIKKSGLNKQSYLYYCAMSKPIEIIDFSHFNDVSNSISNIESIIKENAKNINIDNKSLVSFYIDTCKRLDDIWHILKELL